MKIVLFANNHVVKEFISLAANKISASLDIVQKAQEAGANYDYVLVDDKSELIAESKELLERLPQSISVLFYSGSSENKKFFDNSVKKPFLPSEIEALLNNKKVVTMDKNPTIKESNHELIEKIEVRDHIALDTDTDPVEKIELEIGDLDFEVNSKKVEKPDDAILENQILNRDDINEIKALLGDESIDTAVEKDVIDKVLDDSKELDAQEIAHKTKKSASEKNKKSKKSRQKMKKKTENKKIRKSKSCKKAEKRLLKALFRMKKKEIRSILKDANITLKIKYSEEK